MRKPVFGVSYQVRHKRSVQPQKMARGLKFQIQEVEVVYYVCSEKKRLISSPVNMKLICALVFAYAKSRFSYDADHNFYILDIFFKSL